MRARKRSRGACYDSDSSDRVCACGRVRGHDVGLVGGLEVCGNAALEPLGIAAKGLSPEAGIRIRIDDKLKRWQTLPEGDDEDTVADLIGYLILLRVARGRK